MISSLCFLYFCVSLFGFFFTKLTLVSFFYVPILLLYWWYTSCCVVLVPYDLVCISYTSYCLSCFSLYSHLLLFFFFFKKKNLLTCFGLFLLPVTLFAICSLLLLCVVFFLGGGGVAYVFLFLGCTCGLFCLNLFFFFCFICVLMLVFFRFNLCYWPLSVCMAWTLFCSIDVYSCISKSWFISAADGGCLSVMVVICVCVRDPSSNPPIVPFVVCKIPLPFMMAFFCLCLGETWCPVLRLASNVL